MFVNVQKIVIPIKPKAQSRPRSAVRNGRVFVYEDKETKTHKQAVKMLLQNKIIKDRIESGSNVLGMQLRYFVKGKEGQGFKNTKPDLDNYIKLSWDCGNGVAYEDDAIICRVLAEKFYCTGTSEDPERTEILFQVFVPNDEQAEIMLLRAAIDKHTVFGLAKRINVSWRTIHRLANNKKGVSDKMRNNIMYQIGKMKDLIVLTK